MEPHWTGLRHPRLEVCSRCGSMLYPGNLVLYFAFIHRVGKEILCESCGHWYLGMEGAELLGPERPED